MIPPPPRRPRARLESDGKAHLRLEHVVARFARGGPEQAAIGAGEIDAVVDYGTGKVILFPAARRAIRDSDTARQRVAASGETAHQPSVANSLLAALPLPEYRRLLDSLERVTLTSGEILHEPGVPFRYAYFPVDCVISLLAKVENRRTIEVGMVGHEGLVGISLALGIDSSSIQAAVQGTGIAMRMESAAFRRQFLQSEPLQQAVHRYQHSLMAQIAQSAACSQFHPVTARIARYLLMTSDRSRSRELRLTHGFLSDMLGVRRPSVTEAAGVLQKSMLINNGRRGVITILDRKGLSVLACGCYRVVRDLFGVAQHGAHKLS
jgi:CRP-like cAMP-binding protein